MTHLSSADLALALQALQCYIARSIERDIPPIWYDNHHFGDNNILSEIATAIESQRVLPALHRELYRLKGFDLVSRSLISTILRCTSHSTITSYCPSCG